jgi:hypothetical protein
MAVAKARPTGSADSATVATPTRTGKYAEAAALVYGIGRYGFADEGSYYTATNATIGTQLTAHAAPAIADTDTKSIIHIFNGGLNDIYLDYITIATTVANASATAVYFAGYIDNKGSTAYSSGGTVIGAANKNNVRNNSSNATAAVIEAGAVVTAFTSSRKVFSRETRPSIGIALDQYHFTFGGGLFPSSYSQVTTVAQVATGLPPVIIGPGGNFGLVQTSPSGATTAMTFEFEIGFWER